MLATRTPTRLRDDDKGDDGGHGAAPAGGGRQVRAAAHHQHTAGSKNRPCCPDTKCAMIAQCPN